MFKFIYSLICWCAVHYEELPSDFKAKFPEEKVRDCSLILSNVDFNSKLFEYYEG